MLGLAALSGAAIGALLGLVGGGGGILAVPALVYGLGLPLSTAVPTSLVVIGLASAVAVAPRARRDVNWRLAGIIGAAGVPSALLGSIVNRHLDQHVLLLAFSAIMIVAAVRMLRAASETGGVCDLPGGGWHGDAASPVRSLRDCSSGSSPGCSVSAADSCSSRR